MSATVAKARDLLAAALQVQPESLNQDASIATVPAWDSLAHVRLMAAIEEALGRKLTSDEIVTVVGLPAIVALLDRPRA